MSFVPTKLSLASRPNRRCRAIVILPAKDEESTLQSALDALAVQQDLYGKLLSPHTFEILLLLNNCTDRSAEVAEQWRHNHPHIALHTIALQFSSEESHVGTARRLLMDTAWSRLRSSFAETKAILSTDADTIVAVHWIANNLRALELGADAVGGVIRLESAELKALPSAARKAYMYDCRYRQLVARLEDRIDPQRGDPWPRHLEHFGASLACTPEIYARVGGLPAVKPLEDVAFVDALRRVDAKLRHDPAVIVYTSGRLHGRAEVGLSGQLRQWQRMSETGQTHDVPSAAWLIHRFETLCRMRALRASKDLPRTFGNLTPWRPQICDAQRRQSSVGRFLAAIDSDRIIRELFSGKHEERIEKVIPDLCRAIRSRINYSPMAAAAILPATSSAESAAILGPWPHRLSTASL